MVPLARKNLFEDLPRFLVAQAGIIFAVGLITIQTGILKGFTRSTIQLIKGSTADIWVSSNDMVNLELTASLPYNRLAQAQTVNGVERAEALSTQGAILRAPSGKIVAVRVIGVDPNSQLLSPGTLLQGKLSDLKQPYSFIADTTTLNELDLKAVGDRAVIGNHPAILVGITQGIQSNASSPFLLTSLETAKAYQESPRLLAASIKPTSPALTPLNQHDSIAYILIKAKPGENLQALQKRLNDALPDTRAHTTLDMAQITERYWETRTSVGFILGLGAAVGIIVGMVIVGQILYSSVSDHIQEFGTLKAMGVADRIAYQIIIEQSLWMAVLGYIPGMVLCYGIGLWTATTQGVVILITPTLAVGVLGITVVMCVGSAIFAIQKVTRVDPAIVFKA